MVTGTAGTAGTALTSANGKSKITHADYAPTTEANNIGDTWYVHAAVGETDAGALRAQYQGLGGTAWSASTISHQMIGSVDLGTATVGKLAANYIESGTISAALQLAGMLIAGNPTGARVVIDDDGIRQYNGSGDIVINLPTDDATPAQFEGAVTANSATIESLTLMGLLNQVARGAMLKVSGGTSNPGAAPTFAVGYQTYQPNRWSYLYVPAGLHANTDDSPDITGVMTFFYGGYFLGIANRRYEFPHVTDSAGTDRTIYGGFNSATSVHTAAGAERLVTQGTRTLTNGAVATGSMDSWNTLAMNSGGTTAPTLGAHMDSKADDYVYTTSLGRVFSGVGSTLYKERIAVARWDFLNSRIILQQYTVSDTAFAQVGANIDISIPFTVENEGLIGVTHGSSDKLGFPGAAQFVWLIHSNVKTYAYTANGTARLTDFDFPTPAGAARMFTFGNLATNEFLGFRTTAWTDVTPITKLTNNHWASATYPYKIWASQTWYDADPGGTGVHETAQSPRAPLTLPKRAGFVISGSQYPARPFPTTQDDPLSIKFYVGRSTLGSPASDPGRTYMEYVGTVNSPTRSLAVGTFAFPAGVATTPPPISSNFPASSPGLICSDDGFSWVLQGDGTATLAGVGFDQSKPGFTSGVMRKREFRFTDNTATTYTGSGGTMGARGGEGTFVAPPSGIVKCTVIGQMRAGVAGQYAALAAEIRTGSVVGSGTVVKAAGSVDSINNANPQHVAGEFSHLQVGLTPGDTYNVRVLMLSPTGTGTFAQGRIIIEPSA